MSIAEESSGSKKHAHEIREMVRQLGHQKISRWAAIAAVVLPIVWGASKIDHMTDTMSKDMGKISASFAREIAKLTREVSELRNEIAEVRGMQGAQAVIVVELTKDVEYIRKDINEMNVVLLDQVNKMNYRIADGKAFRARFQMMGQAIPPITDQGVNP